MEQPPIQRVSFFIDGTNLTKGLKESFRFTFTQIEFPTQQALNTFENKIQADGYSIPHNKDQITGLNNFLADINFSKKYLKKNGFRNLPHQAIRLIEQIGTAETLKPKEIIYLNRMILEATYPALCPKKEIIDRLDIFAYCDNLAGLRKTSKIYYAEAPYIQARGEKNHASQQAYLEYIQSRPDILLYRKGYYNNKSNPPVEKQTDVFLAVDIVDACHRDEFDTAFIMSGDSDLCPAIDVLVREGKKIVIVYFDNPDRKAYAVTKRAGRMGSFINITGTIVQNFRWPPIKKEPEPCSPGCTMSIKT